MKPGFNENFDIYTIDERICTDSAKFMQVAIKKGNHNLNFADVGVRNKKVEVIEQALEVKFTQLIANDFNFDFLKAENGASKFDVITCFEVIEHLQNPLFLLNQIAHMIEPEGIIYLSTPSRPRMFWPDFHYHEMNEEHLNKWIFSQVGLKISRRDRLRIYMPFWKHFTGIRPFLRLFLNFTNIYELRLNI